MVIAFDFDGVLDNPIVQRLIKRIRIGNEIWVVTMRKDNSFNRDIILPVISKLGLTNYNVIYCDNKPKVELLKGINADIYIDNISDEFEMIKNTSNVLPLLFLN